MKITKLTSDLKEKILALPFLAATLSLPIFIVKATSSNRSIPEEEFSKIFDYTLFSNATSYTVALLFLIFAAYLILEIFTQQKNNYFQYLLIGLSVCTNFLLNLGIGEFLGFTPAFIISAILTIILHITYTALVSNSFVNSSIIGLSLTIFYGVLYFFIQSTDYNLLILSIISFITVAALMVISHFIQVEDKPKITPPQS